ncbi:hypothetical protein HBF24_12250 [Oleiagrimonas sp. C23AA]|nr:hypothetical protein [Oleiagrimonas sp. C23AA]
MAYLLMGLALLLTALVYWPGLGGGWLFDDFPNIVDNTALHIQHFNVPDLIGAALSSPSSEFKRPLSTLTFAINYLLTGLDPYWMKLTNVVIHLLNGLCVFFLARQLLLLPLHAGGAWEGVEPRGKTSPLRTPSLQSRKGDYRQEGIVAALIAAGWMLLPINITAVLYVVQRMESLANLFVLLGLIGYVAGRMRMLSGRTGGFALSCVSLIAGTGIGALAKETAVMLPLYAALIEWVMFRGCHATKPGTDRRILGLFTVILFLPLALGLAWQIPKVLNPADWATRDFTLGERLLSEARIVLDYMMWTFLPTPHALSFYHDNFTISQNLLHPWTTLPSVLGILALLVGAIALRKRLPLVSLGLLLFFGCHLLTGTILPLELIYEHRNYFASFGLLLAVVPLLAAPRTADGEAWSLRGVPKHLPGSLPRYVLLAGLLLFWTAQTATTAMAWSNPVSLAQDLASRAPNSPRAQYSLGRTYIIYSHYDPSSVFTHMVYAPLERAAKLPDSTILPEQALIFFNARMHRPIKETWWDSMIAKLRKRDAGVEDVSSLAALTKCQIEGNCHLSKQHVVQAFLAALSHPHRSPRLLASYSDYAWNVLDDKTLGLRMAEAAAHAAPNEPNYRITLVRMLIVLGKNKQARQALQQLRTLNYGGRLDGSIATLKSLLNSR